MANPIARRNQKTAQSSKSMVDQWKMDAMKAPATAAGGGGAVRPQPRLRHTNNNNNNNNNVEEESPIEK
jgi:hypothetical protein